MSILSSQLIKWTEILLTPRHVSHDPSIEDAFISLMIPWDCSAKSIFLLCDPTRNNLSTELQYLVSSNKFLIILSTKKFMDSHKSSCQFLTFPVEYDPRYQ